MIPNVTHNWTGPSASSPGLPPRPQKPRHPRLVSSRFREEAGAGGIIYRRREGRLEFFFVKHGKTGRWTFPKGHQELGETLVETAIREIREEAGLKDLRYVASVGKTSFRYRREEVTIQKTVQFFLFEAAPDAKEILTGEEAIWEAIWAPVEKVYETVGYQNLRRLLARAIRLIDDRPRQEPRYPHAPRPSFPPNRPPSGEEPRRRIRVHY